MSKGKLLVAIAMLTALPLSAATTSNQSGAKIESVKSKVDVKSPGSPNWRSARQNVNLKTSDSLRTGSKSMARIKLADGSKVLVLPNSQVELENISSVQRAIRLVRGRLRAVVRRVREGSSFQVKTPIGVASVRGTEFEVGYEDGNEKMAVDVFSGQVGVAKLEDLETEILVNPGESINFGLEGDIGDPIRSGAVPMDKQDVVAEVIDSKVKDSVVAMAADELKNADYQTAKSLIDVDGRRVRVEEYITRPAANQFKLVSLNERDTRFDYFTYTGTFNTSLPDDLSIALRDVNGKLGSTQPDYYLTEYEMFMSNTHDTISDTATGGHLVKIDVSGTGSSMQYTLTNVDGLGNTTSRVVDAAEIQGDGSYRVYDPIGDKFSLVAATKLDDALKVSVLDGDKYRDLATSDTYWRTRYNTTEFRINNVLKTSYAPYGTVTNVLATDLDGSFTNAPIIPISEFPSGENQLHNRLTLIYNDGSKLVYDNYIINDDGKVATTDDFSGVSTSADYQNELVKWNYQQKVKATEMSDSINLVIDPRIGTMSGLIK